MIAGVTVPVEGGAETFRMTTRAMIAIEGRTGKGLLQTLSSIEGDFRVAEIVGILAECADDGRGVEDAVAMTIVDQLGGTRAAELIGELAQAAFPDADNGQAAPGKNQKRAVRGK